MCYYSTGFCASDVLSLNVNTVTGAEKTSTEQLDMFEHDHKYNCC